MTAEDGAAEGERAFTYRSSRSGAFLGALTMAVLVETVAVHLWLHDRFPRLSWTLVVLSLLSLVWLLADYRARGTRAVLLRREGLELAIGLQRPILLEPEGIARAIAPTWRDLPATDAPYLNLTAPAQPNVLIDLDRLVAVPVVVGIRRKVRQIGLHLDEPDAFLAALHESHLSQPKAR